MKIVVYGVVHWNDKKHAKEQKDHIVEWYQRCKKFIPLSDLFLSAGTYSDPKYNPLSIPIVNNGIKYTREYCIEWNYFRNGFMTGIWHAALNLDYDILFHVQCRNLIGDNLTSYLIDFWSREEIIMAPQWKASRFGICVENSFMAMKKPAVESYLAGGLRPSLATFNPVLNTEQEAFHLFNEGGNWYNPFHWITSIRKRDPDKWNAGRRNSQYDVSMVDFLKLPFIATNRHCSEVEKNDWKLRHPVEGF